VKGENEFLVNGVTLRALACFNASLNMFFFGVVVLVSGRCSC
jgi:hypothetical protein